MTELVTIAVLLYSLTFGGGTTTTSAATSSSIDTSVSCDIQGGPVPK